MAGSINHSGPALNGVAVSAGDSIAQTRALHCNGTAGLVYVDFGGGGSNVPLYIGQGDVLPVQVTKVYSTSTTATGLIALY